MGHWICIVVVLQCQWGWDSIGSPMAIEGMVSRTGLAGWQHVSKYFWPVSHNWRMLAYAVRKIR